MCAIMVVTERQTQRAYFFSPQKQNSYYSLKSPVVVFGGSIRLEFAAPANVTDTTTGLFCLQNMSHLQDTVKHKLQLLFSGFNVSENYRPDWLQNPVTGKNLELDFWIPEHRVGIEVQGRQHYEFVSVFHETEDDLLKQIERDKLKKKMCSELGVTLIEVSTAEDVNEMIYHLQIISNELSMKLLKKLTTINWLSYYSARIRRNDEYKVSDCIGMLARMERSARKHNIKIADIRPNYSLTSFQLSFNNKPIVEVEAPNFRVEAAVMSYSKSKVRIRWWKSERNCEDAFMHCNFDRKTGWSKGRNSNRWWTNPDVLNKKIKYNYWRGKADSRS